MKFCCDQFKYLVETGQLKDFGDGELYRLCADCECHNGDPEKYCSNCGAKITNV